MIEAHPGLRDEIIEIFTANRDQTADVLLATLNGPARIQQRGFRVVAEQLLAVIIDTWRINDKSRFLLYDIDAERIAFGDLFFTQEQATAEADQRGDDVIVLRFDVP